MHGFLAQSGAKRKGGRINFPSAVKDDEMASAGSFIFRCPWLATDNKFPNPRVIPALQCVTPLQQNHCFMIWALGRRKSTSISGLQPVVVILNQYKYSYASALSW